MRNSRCVGAQLEMYVNMYTHTCQYHDSLQLLHGAMTGIMGTRFGIVLPTENRAAAEKLWIGIVSILSRLDKMLNRFNPQSELSKINIEAHRNAVSITPEMLQILQLCAEYHRKTCGYFDITLCDFSKVHINKQAETVCFTEKITLDLGGFAKGYAMKHIGQIIKDEGFADAFVDFAGSSITAFGHHPYGDCWKVSVGNPFDGGKVLGEFELRDTSMSVSGNTPTYDGHIINPFSKKYVKEKKMICVVASNVLDAEVLTTALMVAPDAEQEKILCNFAVEKKVEYVL